MKKVKKNRGMDFLKDKYGRMFTTPWLIGIILFHLIPLCQSIIYSLAKVTVVPGGMQIDWVGFENYNEVLFVNPYYTSWIGDAIVSFLSSFPIILLLSLVLACFLNQKFRGRLFFRALYFLPVIIASGPVVTWLFQTTNSDMTGLGVAESYTMNMLSVDDIIRSLQIDGRLAEYITKIISKIFDLIWSCGIQTVLFLAGLQAIPRTLYEASYVEGATKWEELWFITLPMLARVILLVSVFTMVEIITDTRSTMIAATYDMMRGGVYDISSAMLWWYFFALGCVMAALIFLYKKTLMRHWDA